jgi:DNA-binding transcriptional MerR regulator
MTRSRTDLRQPRYSISELANEFDISPRTIRFYEEKNLISPARSKGNQRVYTRRDRARLKLILRGKRFGYSLDEISEMIGMTDVDISERAQIQKSLIYGDKKLAEIRERREELKLLEQDILNVKTKLLKRLEELDRT